MISDSQVALSLPTPPPQPTSRGRVTMLKKKRAKKNKYLTRMCDALKNYEEILDPCDNEDQQDEKLLKYLFNDDKVSKFDGVPKTWYHVNQAYQEVLLLLQEWRQYAIKSESRTQSFLLEAEQCLQNQDYKQAIINYSRATSNLPLNVKEDYDKLATIYYRRVKCWLALNAEEDAAADMQLMYMANAELAEKLLSTFDKEIAFKFSNSSISPGSNTKKDFQLGTKVEITTQRNDQRTLVKLWTPNGMDARGVVLREKPFVRVNGFTETLCANCYCELERTHFWPCAFCNEIVYCSRDCSQKGSAVHKFECGIYGCLINEGVPQFLLMLRFYARCQSTPVTPYDPQNDYISPLLDTVVKQSSHSENGADWSGVPGHQILNAFRQSMDQHDRRLMLHSNRRRYLASVVQAIEFMCVYDLAHKNANLVQWDQILNRELKISGANDEEIMLQQDNLILNFDTNGNECGGGGGANFAWARDALGGSVENEKLIPFVFRDYKRFVASPLIKYRPPFTVLKEVNEERRDRQVLLLSGIFFPTFIGNKTILPIDGEAADANASASASASDSPTNDNYNSNQQQQLFMGQPLGDTYRLASLANVAPRYDKQSAVMTMITTRAVAPMEKLATKRYNAKY